MAGTALRVLRTIGVRHLFRRHLHGRGILSTHAFSRLAWIPMILRGFGLFAAACVGSFWGCSLSGAQEPGSTDPTVGLRRNPPQVVALVGARIVVQPNEVIEEGTLILDGSLIKEVGNQAQVTIPDGADIVDCKGQTIYPGLIDAWSEAEVPDPPKDRGTPHWNGNVMPQRNAQDVAGTFKDANKNLRSQGITLRVIAPQGGIVQGTSCAVLTSDKPGNSTLVVDRLWQHLQLTVPRDKSRDRYPNSPMGAVALLRQTLYDAQWYRDAKVAYLNSPQLPSPQANAALEVLAQQMASGTFLIDAPNERMALRADNVAKEFSLNVILKGSGREYRDLEAIVKCGYPVLVPVAFPEPPNVIAESVERTVTQTELMHWKFAPENPRRLVDAGATICLTTAGLKDVAQFLKQARVAVKNGLSSEDALAAITSTPAKLIGLEAKCGSLSRGKMANLVITDGDLFAEKTKVISTWVGGERFEIAKAGTPRPQPGQWTFQLKSPELPEIGLNLKIDKDGKSMFSSSDSTDGSKATDAVPLQNVVAERHRVQGTLNASSIDVRLPSGTSRVSLVYSQPADAEPSIQLTLQFPDRTRLQAIGTTQQPEKQEEGTKTTEPDEATDDDKATEEVKDQDDMKEQEDVKEQAVAKAAPLNLDVVYPLGAYGLKQPIAPRGDVVLRGATVWTAGPAGTIENADILIRDGKIAEIGESISIPKDAEVISVKGKHISPGIIDCHSHMATDGGVNESGQAITAEVRIGDFIDPSDIVIYRQLACGVTAANVLHGSANPIGGQNQVIKLRWGASMEEMVMNEAPPGIKFALGENVKQSNRGSGRYPGSRMGVEQIIRDQLMAARLYDSEHKRYRNGNREGLPPRKDLQLEALAEVLRHERWVHCHSYRQDEIITFLDVLEEFNVQVGTLQHVLEGYKVTERLKRHGAMASTFADWWGYKFEAFDAIPHNGALMHRGGVNVSFNSDFAELGTHLNTEAAKAVKYGGVSEEDALRFVTLNPAMQLRIADRTGSIEVGKDADLVVWSGPPLSTMARCEQTWIDGRQYFSLQQDAELRVRDSQIRASLIQEVLALKPEKSSGAKKSSDAVEEEQRWGRIDAFCRCNELQAKEIRNAR
jgi:imidazolonepropionase-like amidohydrolase